MRRSVLLSTSIYIASALVSQEHDADEPSFDAFVREHGRKYVAGTDEYALREKVFKQNLEHVRSLHNREKKHWEAHVNKFTDWTDEEYNALMGYKPDFEQTNKVVALRAAHGVHVPHALDWRDQMSGTDFFHRDQGACGSCWAVGSIACLEAHMQIKHQRTARLSVQSVLSCTANPRWCGGKGGCEGATAQLAYDWIANNSGIPLEENYEYSSAFGGTGTCDRKKISNKAVTLSGYRQAPRNSYKAVIEALTSQGPMVVGVGASDWRYYNFGVFDGCPPDLVLNHAVVLVGFGVDSRKNKPFWVLQNSWGENWGESGSIRLLRHTGDYQHCGINDHPEDGSACLKDADLPKTVDVCGMCGILYEAVVPLGVKMIE